MHSVYYIIYITSVMIDLTGLYHFSSCSGHRRIMWTYLLTVCGMALHLIYGLCIDVHAWYMVTTCLFVTACIIMYKYYKL